MAYQVCIINPRGVTMRTGPSTSGAEIRGVLHGEVLDVERLIFSKPQNFDINFIPSFLEAQRKGLVMGDVWCQLSGKHIYKNDHVIGYVAMRVFTTTYGALAGAVSSPVPIQNGDIQSRVAEIDEMIRYLSVRRMELSGRQA
jgi:hypothetical protein